MYRMGVFLVVLMLSACREGEVQMQDEVSDSGLAYTRVSMPDNDRITVRIAWPSQWAFDDEANQAIPYIASRLLLTAGTTNYSAAEVEERFADMNSSGFLSPTPEQVLGVLHYSPEHQADTLKIVNEHLTKPALDARWLERVRDEFSAQIAEVRSKAASEGFEALRWAIFGDQSIRRALSVEDPDMIDNVSRADIANWLDTIIKRNGAQIVVAGDLNAEEADVIVDTLFDGIPEGVAADKPTVEANFSPRRILLHTPGEEVSNLSFIGPLPAWHDAGYDDILLTQMLGVGNQSVLFDTVRTQLRASYDFSAAMDAFTIDNRILIMTGQVETAKVAEAERVIRQAYASFLEAGPYNNLEKRKGALQESLQEVLKDTGATANSALMGKLGGKDTATILSELASFETLTVEDLQQRLSEGFPKADDLIVVATSPDADALADACVITEPEQAAACE